MSTPPKMDGVIRMSLSPDRGTVEEPNRNRPRLVCCQESQIVAQGLSPAIPPPGRWSAVAVALAEPTAGRRTSSPPSIRGWEKPFHPRFGSITLVQFLDL